jgi:hypothetical protein
MKDKLIDKLIKASFQVTDAVCGKLAYIPCYVPFFINKLNLEI